MSSKPKVLVMGATGQVGRAVASLLSRNPNLDTVAAARTPAKAAHLGVPGVHLDLDKIETFAPALQGVDRIFMATGYTVDMLRQSKDLVNMAKKAGIKQIVHLGACEDDDTRVAHYGWHQFIERYIEWSGVTFTHLRPEIFMQNLLGYGGESYVKNGVVRHYVGGAQMSWVDCDDVAAVAAACLTEPERHAQKTYRLGYEAKSYREVAETFTQVLGQPFSYEPRPPSEFLSNVLATGAEPAYMRCVFESYSDLTDGKGIGADHVSDNFTCITGRQPGTIGDFARKYADRFRY
jgi:NAD(P)H dehydrogenase (quinone)